MATATRLQFLHQCILKKKKGCNNNLKTNFLPHHLVWTYLALPNTHSYIKLHIKRHANMCAHGACHGRSSAWQRLERVGMLLVSTTGQCPPALLDCGTVNSSP